VVERSAGLRVTTEDGVRLAVTVSGGGEPLVMIPGLGATHRVYAPIVPALENSFTVIVYDPRGTGDSDVPTGPYPMSRLAADCAAVATAVGAETFHLFGASMGGEAGHRVWPGGHIGVAGATGVVHDHREGILQGGDDGLVHPAGGPQPGDHDQRFAVAGDRDGEPDTILGGDAQTGGCLDHKAGS
jgi:hypothetical protein